MVHECQVWCKISAIFWPPGKKTVWSVPLYSVDSEGRVVRINYNNATRDSVLDLPLDQVQPFYSSLKSFVELMNQPENMVTYRMEPGQSTGTEKLMTPLLFCSTNSLYWFENENLAQSLLKRFLNKKLELLLFALLLFGFSSYWPANEQQIQNLAGYFMYGVSFFLFYQANYMESLWSVWCRGQHLMENRATYPVAVARTWVWKCSLVLSSSVR